MTIGRSVLEKMSVYNKLSRIMTNQISLLYSSTMETGTVDALILKLKEFSKPCKCDLDM